MSRRAETLLAAVAAWKAAPPDPARDTFLGKVAENAKAIVERDQALASPLDLAAATRMAALLGRADDIATPHAELAEAIRSGALAYNDPALLDHLRRTALADLSVEQPRYRHGLLEPE